MSDAARLVIKAPQCHLSGGGGVWPREAFLSSGTVVYKPGARGHSEEERVSGAMPCAPLPGGDPERHPVWGHFLQNRRCRLSPLPGTRTAPRPPPGSSPPPRRPQPLRARLLHRPAGRRALPPSPLTPLMNNKMRLSLLELPGRPALRGRELSAGGVARKVQAGAADLQFLGSVGAARALLPPALRVPASLLSPEASSLLMGKGDRRENWPRAGG